MRRLFLLGLFLAAPALGQPQAAYRGRPVSEWIAGLADADIRVRWYAAYALGQIGPEAAEAVGPLSEIVADKYGHEYVRGGAAWALGRMGPGAEPAVGRLIETLESNPRPVGSVRRNVPLALGSIGPAAKPAVPALVKLLDDEDAGVRVNAAAALWKIDRHERATAALVDMMKRGTGTGAYKAAVALGSLGKGDRSNLCEAPFGPFRQIGPVPFSELAAAALIEALGHADADVARAAARALGQVGPATIPALQAALTAREEQSRRYAAEALGWIGPPAVPALIEALGNDQPSVRVTAAGELGRLGPKSQSARPALIRAVDDPDPQVRAAAARALSQIGPALEGQPAAETEGRPVPATDPPYG